MRGAIPYPFATRRKNRMSTYGLKGLFGGWMFERNHRSQRVRMRRQWRKAARREAKRWIQEQLA